MVMDLRTPRDLSAIIRGARIDRGLSQEDLAVRSGVSRKMINELERGASDPRMSNVLAILDSLGLALNARRAESEKAPGIDLDSHLGELDDE